MENAETGSKNVTLADVRGALGDTDPHQTNSSKLRAVLGRGSLATIQRHLEAIRAEQIKAQQPLEAAPVPAMSDEFKALWAPIYTAAISTVRARLDAVISERDRLALAVATGRADISALEQVIEQDERTAADQAALLAAATAAIDAHKSEIDGELAAAEKAATAHQATLDALAKQITDAEHRFEIEKRDHALSKTALQTTIDRLTDQVGELKSMLHSAKK
jgi:vacuolar-type H+-ATPase subunit I/STV1